MIELSDEQRKYLQDGRPVRVRDNGQEYVLLLPDVYQRVSEGEPLQQAEGPLPVSKERQQALQQLIGIWKTEQPPNDEQVEQILEQERLKKYG